GHRRRDHRKHPPWDRRCFRCRVGAPGDREISPQSRAATEYSAEGRRRSSTQKALRQACHRRGGIMQVTGITANLPVADIAAASEFYREYLGLSVEAMNLGWVARDATAEGAVAVHRVT